MRHTYYDRYNIPTAILQCSKQNSYDSLSQHREIIYHRQIELFQ